MADERDDITKLKGEKEAAEAAAKEKQDAMNAKVEEQKAKEAEEHNKTEDMEETAGA